MPPSEKHRLHNPSDHNSSGLNPFDRNPFGLNSLRTFFRAYVALDLPEADLPEADLPEAGFFSADLPI